MKHALLFLLILSLVLSCSRCKEHECTDSHNPDCPNYVAPTPVDPCASRHEVSADFEIYQNGNYPSDEDWALTPGDVLPSRMLKLHALTNNATSYKWLVGLDTISAQDYEFYFPTSFENETVAITLIIQSEIDSLCFPNDNGLDTVVKYIHVHETCDRAWIGTWRGAYEDSPLDTFDIHVTQHSNPANTIWQPVECNSIWVRGVDLFYNDSCRVDYDSPFTYNYAYIGGSYPCYGDAMKMYVSDDLQFVRITINLHESLDPNISTDHNFNGRRIQ
jgi:hypothetical protein